MIKRLPIPKLQQLPKLKQFASTFRFTLQKKLILAFILIAILFCILGLTARTALKSGETAVQSVLATGKAAFTLGSAMRSDRSFSGVGIQFPATITGL